MTQNPTAFRRWVLSGPELRRLLVEFEDQYINVCVPENPEHFANHEQGISAQKMFQKQMNSVTDVMRQMGNPFLDNFPDLVTLDRRKCADKRKVDAMYGIQELGKQQYLSFVNQVIID